MCVCVWNEKEKERERKCGKILRIVNLKEGYRGILCTVLATVQQILSIIKRKLRKQNRTRLMLRILGQKYSFFQCTWTRKQVAASTPGSYTLPLREVSCRTEQVLCVEEWKDRNYTLNGIIELLNLPNRKPLPSDYFIFAEKYLGLGILFIFRVLTNKIELSHQIGKHSACAIASGRVFFLCIVLFVDVGSIDYISARSHWSLQTLELLNYLKSINVKIWS